MIMSKTIKILLSLFYVAWIVGITWSNFTGLPPQLDCEVLVYTEFYAIQFPWMFCKFQNFLNSHSLLFYFSNVVTIILYGFMVLVIWSIDPKEKTDG